MKIAGPAVLTLGAALSLSPAIVHAEIGGDSGEWESDKTGSFGVTGGLFYPIDDSLQAVYGSDGLAQTHLVLGYRLVDFLKIDAGFFLAGSAGNPLGQATGDASAEEAKLVVLGLELGPTLRLDFFREQPVVPYASAGISWALFRDKESETSEAVVGDKAGWYYAAGLELLLDRFEPARAADLDISRGINDTYLTLEYRRQTLTELGETSNLDLTADSLSIGLKFDF